MSIFLTIIIFLIVLAVLVFVHELGHFALAKLFGIRVDEFGLGFPPRLLSWRPRGGETLYSLNLIPFGGFVRIFGENGDPEGAGETILKNSFTHKPKIVQVIVLLAGILFNLIFAWAILVGSFMVGAPNPSYDSHQLGPVTITEVVSKSAASKAGLQVGDILVSLSAIHTATSTSKSKVATTTDVLVQKDMSPDTVQSFIKNHNTQVITISFTDSGTMKVAQAKPDPILGIAMSVITTDHYSFKESIIQGSAFFSTIVTFTFTSILHFLKDIFTFHANIAAVSGPVAMAGMVGDAARLGFSSLLTFMAFISINLALLNLIPFPALDGGRTLFVIIEAITRRKIPAKVSGIINTVGFSLLILLMIVVTVHDILKLW